MANETNRGCDHKFVDSSKDYEREGGFREELDLVRKIGQTIATLEDYMLAMVVPRETNSSLALQIPITEASGQSGGSSTIASVDKPLPAVRSGELPPEGPGSGGYKPLMRNPRAQLQGRADRDTAGNNLAPGMVSEENSGRLEAGEEHRDSAHETPGAAPSGATIARITNSRAEFYATRKKLWEDWQDLEKRRPADAPLSRKEAAELLGVGEVTLWRLERDVAAKGDQAFESQRHLCGRRPEVMPTADELACVHEIYIRLDESKARGRGRGSSKVTAFRLAAKSDDPRIGDVFRSIVLKRRHKTVPPSWERLLDTTASVLDYARDRRSTTSKYISTPRSRSYIDANGEELPMRAGTILEADDGTFNMYATIPWPFGGDRCSDKFGVKLGRWQLLAVVDARWEFCPSFDIVARNLSSYRGEDSGCLLGRTMAEVCKPELWRLERGSWESAFVRDALKLCQVPCRNAWNSKQKSAVERFFDRLWTPASLIPGHVGRDRARYKHVQDLAASCQDGRRDPREHFLSLSAAVPKVIAAVQFVNSEPIESRTWGRWVPQERFEAQMTEAATQIKRLDPTLRIFFSREQRTWTVRGNLVGGPVEGPMIRFPVFFQCPELWEFEGCRVKCYFDPYAEPVLGTLVLQDEWRSCKPGHVIARDVPALDLPPQVVMANGHSADARSLQIRKAISKAVRTECWSWLGKRSTEARDGMGNVAKADHLAGSGVLPPSENRDANLQINNCKSASGSRRERPVAVANAEDFNAMVTSRENVPAEAERPAYAISEEDMNQL